MIHCLGAKGETAMKRLHYILLLWIAAVLLAGCALTPESVLDVVAPSETPLPGSDLVFSGVVESTPEPVYLTYSEMDGNFCPFWADKDGDRMVVSLTQLCLISKDGRPAPAEIRRLYNEDGSTGVVITLREGLVCSDGFPLTADDLLFTYYVLADEDYDGPAGIKTLPIRGLPAYWNGIDPDMYSKYVFLYDEIYKNGNYDSDLRDAVDKARSELQRQGVAEARWMDNATYRNACGALDNYDSARAEEIRTAIEQAWRKDSDALVDYIMTHYSTTITMNTDYSIDEIWETKGLQIMCAMRERLVGELREDKTFVSLSGKTWNLVDEFPTADDMYEEMYALYKGDAEQYWAIEGVGRPSMLDAVENEIVRRWAAEDPDWRGTVESISGIERLDDRTVAVTLEYCDDAVERSLTDIYVTPLHVYGNMEHFDPESNSFGFTKGDLRQVKINSKIALGAGEFVYKATDFRTVYFTASETYWHGKSATEQIILSKMPEPSSEPDMTDNGMEENIIPAETPASEG